MTKAKAFIGRNLSQHLETQMEYVKREIEGNTHPLLTEFGSLINLNILLGNSPITLNNTVDMFLWGKDKFARLIEDIENAKDSINIEYFTFRNDAIGSRIMDLLCQKAKEGLSVRFIYDDFGSILTPSSFFNRLKKAGGQVTPFFPVRAGMIFSMNYRNHRKIVVIDGKIGYTGGFNVGDEYVNQSRYRKVLWRDTHVRLTGKSVHYLQLIFLIDWYSVCMDDKTLEDKIAIARFFPVTDSPDPDHPNTRNEDIPIQIVSSGPNDHNTEIRDAMIRLIMSAREYVYIQSPYFTPDEAFYEALKITALSGIDVRIMVPDKWDKFYVKAAAMEYIREMLNFGIRFYHYPGFIHSKSIVADGKAVTIGTTNIDTRSFALHFEVNAFFYSSSFGKECETIFLEDQKKCRQSCKEDYEKRFILARAWWGFCKLFSTLM
jgi:cardiolipin synthase